MKDKKVMALALALPSLILATTISVFFLIEYEKISPEIGISIIVLTVFNTLYLMIRHVNKR